MARPSIHTAVHAGHVWRGHTWLTRVVRRQHFNDRTDKPISRRWSPPCASVRRQGVGGAVDGLELGPDGGGALPIVEHRQARGGRAHPAARAQRRLDGMRCQPQRCGQGGRRRRRELRCPDLRSGASPVLRDHPPHKSGWGWAGGWGKGHHEKHGAVGGAGSVVNLEYLSSQPSPRCGRT